MKYFNDQLKKDLPIIEMSVETLKEEGDSDAAMNYLLFMRDEINKQIKAERKARKA